MFRSDSLRKFQIGRRFSSFKDTVLYEDKQVIAINKPATALVQGDKSGSFNLLDATKEYIKSIYQKPGNAFVGLVHRLDRPCSGVIVFAKTSKAAARLSESFRSRMVNKHYVCVVNGALHGSGTLHHSIKKTSMEKVTVLKDLSQEAHNQTLRGAVEAKLKYSVLENIPTPNNKHCQTQTLVLIELETGRKHQIRAQLSFIGHPIVGDMKYNAPQSFRERDISLHACSLTFPHPVLDKNITCSARVPEVWEKRHGNVVVSSVDKLIASLEKYNY